MDSSLMNAQAETALIKLRIDVDYPYPSRFRSFIYTALGMKMGGDYLRNSKIVARMINESLKDVRAYWFFTPKTMPDNELLKMLGESKHEIGLHIVNDPYGELELLKKTSGRTVRYYTVHGTERIFGRLIWRRQEKALKVPEDYLLQSFYVFPTLHLDRLCHTHGTEESFRIANESIAKGEVLHIHPIWLFQRGRMNPRGPYYETLRRILDIDKEAEALIVRKKYFFTIAADAREYDVDTRPTDAFIEKLKERNVDLFTFIERKWCCPLVNPPEFWVKADDNIALLQITTYDEWLKLVGKKTRNMIRKAEKSGIRTEAVEPSKKLAEGIWKIYNETPIRQERGFPHYGTSLKGVTEMVLSPQNCTYIVSYIQDHLVGFIQLVHGDQTARIAQILSMQEHWDKAINNALVAKAVEVCAGKGIKWIMYGRMGNHPSLDSFKINNGCVKFDLTRYYIPLTRKGRIATKLGLHREVKDVLPQAVKYRLIPIYNWISRTNMRIKARSKPKFVS
jgi:hypothetical protein